MTLEELLQKRDQEILELRERNAELDELLIEYEENDIGFVLSDTEKSMLNIIKEQINILAETSRSTSLDKDQVKTFDILVKDLVAIRGKIPAVKKEEIEETEEEIGNLIALAKRE